MLLLLSLGCATSPLAADEPPHITIFRKWLGHQEQRPNRSPLIDRINRHAKNPLGSPYCAAAWGYALDSAGAITPEYRGGLAIRYRTSESILATDVLRGNATLRQGDLGGFRKGKTIFGHLVCVDSVIDQRTIITLEANTSAGRRGSQRDGDGFYKRVRKIRPYDYFRLEFFTRPTYAEETRKPSGLSRPDHPAGSLYGSMVVAGMCWSLGGVFAHRIRPCARDSLQDLDGDGARHRGGGETTNGDPRGAGSGDCAR